MGSTFSSLIYHIVFHTKYNKPLLENFKNEFHKYITGIVKGEGGYLLAIGGTSNHVHIVVRLLPRHCIADIVKRIKGNSSKWVNENNKVDCRFSWQIGYGVFTLRESGLKTLIRYVNNQEEHHRKKTVQKEYLDFLKAHQIDYDERYIWD